MTFKYACQAVIFDLDGTLLDSVRLYMKILKEIWRRAGIPEPPVATALRIMAEGKPLWENFNCLVPSDFTDDLVALKEKCLEIDRIVWAEIFAREIDLVPGAIETLLLLEEKGFKLGIVTSSWGEENFVPFVKRGVDPNQLFGQIVTRHHVAKHKPAPDPILYCLKQLDIDPSRAVYVGDAPVDIQAGQAAGTKTVAVLTGVGSKEFLLTYGPDAVIDDVRGIVEYLGVNK